MSLPTSCGTSYYVFNPKAYSVPAAYTYYVTKKEGQNRLSVPNRRRIWRVDAVVVGDHMCGWVGEKGMFGVGQGARRD